jgi:hypothetical protein
MPLSSVRCQYEVKHIPGATPETEDFKVTSRCDLDHDGEYAIFEASRAQTATRTTPEDVY